MVVLFGANAVVLSLDWALRPYDAASLAYSQDPDVLRSLHLITAAAMVYRRRWLPFPVVCLATAPLVVVKVRAGRSRRT